MIVFEELKAKLAEQHDPDAICELLGIASEELVEAFGDRIEARFSLLVKEVD